MIGASLSENVLKSIVFATILTFCAPSFAAEKITASHQFLNVTTTLDNKEEQNIALTLDACEGQTDWRILHLLVDKRIKATVFATENWINQNPQAVNYIQSHRDIFDVENHGKEHKEAVFQAQGAYHLPATQNQAGLEKEVLDGKRAIEKAFGETPTWYRDAGALYDEQSLNWLKAQHIKVGGYSIAADEGATASTSRILHLLSTAKAGDVLLMHMNKPQAHTYEGLELGLPLLEQKGLNFVWLPKD